MVQRLLFLYGLMKVGVKRLACRIMPQDGVSLQNGKDGLLHALKTAPNSGDDLRLARRGRRQAVQPATKIFDSLNYVSGEFGNRVFPSLLALALGTPTYILGFRQSAQ